MLVRPAAAIDTGDGEGISVLMVRRSASSSFVPDVFVFPGGTLDPADYDSLPPEGWNEERIAREFRSVISQSLPASQEPIAQRDARALVRAAVRELAEEVAIVLDPGEMRLFSHWITPSNEARRYNTHFFVARGPAGQEGVADAVETHDAVWIAPREALERSARAEFSLVYPTVKHLERLASFSNVDALLAFAQTKPIVTIVPNGSRADGFSMPQQLEDAW
jgi:recombination protein RecT